MMMIGIFSFVNQSFDVVNNCKRNDVIQHMSFTNQFFKIYLKTVQGNWLMVAFRKLIISLQGYNVMHFDQCYALA
jgi:hypothetical protein